MVLRVDVFGELGARHDLAGVMEQVGEHTEFVAGQGECLAVDADAPAAGVEHQRPAGDLGIYRRYWPEWLGWAVVDDWLAGNITVPVRDAALMGPVE